MDISFGREIAPTLTGNAVPVRLENYIENSSAERLSMTRKVIEITVLLLAVGLAISTGRLWSQAVANAQIQGLITDPAER